MYIPGALSAKNSLNREKKTILSTNKEGSTGRRILSDAYQSSGRR